MNANIDKELLESTSRSRDAREGAGSFTQPIGSVSIDVIGSGGKVRHSGTFSSSNPYAAQIAQASNNQDRDSLYNMALQWEGNYATLKEQREYDDPKQQIARQRAAGINPDLTGSGSGGTSSGSSATMSPVQPVVETNNAYANQDRIIAGVNSAASLIGSIGSFATGVTSAMSAISLLGPNKRIADSNANVLEQTEDARVAIANENARNSKISGMRSHLEYIHQLAGYTTAETTDEELNNILSANGISADDIPRYAKDVRTLQRNPQMQALVAEGIKQRNKADAYNNIYSREVLGHLYSAQKQLETLTLQDNLSKAFIASEISHALAHDDAYIDNQIDASLLDGKTRLTATELKNARVVEAYKSYGRQVQSRIDMLQSLRAEISDLEASLNNTNWNKINEPERVQKEGALAALRVREMALYSYCANEYGILQNIYNTSQHLKYIEQFTNIGKPGSELISDAHVQYSNLAFSDILNSNGSIASLIDNFTGITLGDHFTTTDSNGYTYKINMIQSMLNSLQ